MPPSLSCNLERFGGQDLLAVLRMSLRIDRTDVKECAFDTMCSVNVKAQCLQIVEADSQSSNFVRSWHLKLAKAEIRNKKDQPRSLVAMAITRSSQ